MWLLSRHSSWCRYRAALHSRRSAEVAQLLALCQRAKGSWSHTVNVPQTTFPLHPTNAERIDFEAQLHKRAAFSGLYAWQREQSWAEEFILQDGPPYANGKAHIGHAVNRILKDIILRYKVLRRVRVRFQPGWDCHGLPIELRALSQTRHDPAKMTPLAIRSTAAEFASEAIRLQREAFQRWGLLGDWENCYRTSDSRYIAKQLRLLSSLYGRGLVYRALKPIHWSPSSRTALAESELEYNDQHCSNSLYLRLPLVKHPFSSSQDGQTDVFLLIWTTTPWSLAANQAVCISEQMDYVLATIEGWRGLYVVASQLCQQLSQQLGRCVSAERQITTETLLKHCRYRRPIGVRQSCDVAGHVSADERHAPLLASSHVTGDRGTGLVHTAPAHGCDDFRVAEEHGIEPLILIDSSGCYTDAVVEGNLAGRSVLGDGDRLILQHLHSDVVHVGKLEHSYPYDWRTRQPVITVTSYQWFIDTLKLKQPSMDALKHVQVIPQDLTAGMRSQLASRTYWCISRQRCWGVPLPVFYDVIDDGVTSPVISCDIIDHVADLIETNGADIWWQWSESQLLPPTFVQQRRQSRQALPVKGKDILDIWVDSGSAWLATQPDGLSRPADLCLEGIDQFNGWFYSSLLTSVACTQRAPYKSLFVHGFVVDQNGRKMSKSLGNVVDPMDVVQGAADGGVAHRPSRGADCLRLWVACHACSSSHIMIGERALQLCAEQLFRWRNTLRFLLGSLRRQTMTSSQTTPTGEPQEGWADNAPLIDRYMLHCLAVFTDQCGELYDQFQFNRVITLMNNFLVQQVSAFYIDCIRHRLYCGHASCGNDPQMALVVLRSILTVVRQAAAPVLPHLAEEIAEHDPGFSDDSVFHAGWPTVPSRWRCDRVAREMAPLLRLRAHIHQHMPAAKTPRFEVVLRPTSDDWKAILSGVQNIPSRSCDSQLVEILPVDYVSLTDSDVLSVDQSAISVPLDGVDVIITPTNQSKCPRCYRYVSNSANQMCVSCSLTLSELSIQD